jgi:hypothetical protein
VMRMANENHVHRSPPKADRRDRRHRQALRVRRDMARTANTVWPPGHLTNGALLHGPLRPTCSFTHNNFSDHAGR